MRKNNHDLALPGALLVSYTYPPISAPGSIRMAKFSQYLPEHGWRPIVLTVRNGYNPGGKPLPVPHSDVLHIERSVDIDPFKRLLARRTGGRPTNRSNSGGKNSGTGIELAKRLYYAVAFPDRDWLWLPGAIHTGRKLLQRSDLSISVIFSTSPYITYHVVAMYLKRLSGLPWVADFRDYWAFSALRPPRSRLRSALERCLERKVCEQADGLVFISEEYRKRFITEYGLSPERATVIHNGFDPGDFPPVSVESAFPKFSIAHAGTFYGGERDPSVLFVALRELADGGEIDLSDVVLDFYGHREPTVHHLVVAAGLEGVVEWHGYVDYGDLLSRLQNTFCLLLVTHRADDTVTSKIFDYMGCGRPVVAISPVGGTVDGIVTRTGIGAVVGHDDIEGMKQVLRDYWQRWRRGDMEGHETGAQELRPYTRPYQAAQLTALFDEVVANQSDKSGSQKPS